MSSYDAPGGPAVIPTGTHIPPDPASALLDTFPPAGGTTDSSTIPPGVLSACGISWDASDIARFLDKTSVNSDGCLIWNGARSRGRGNTAWYGTFHTKGKSVRAHKFYAVAVLGQRPQPTIHHLDHTCLNSLCVRHIDCVPVQINLRLRWIRVQVGADDDADREFLIRERMQKWLLEVGPSKFLPSDALALRTKFGLPENWFIPDLFDPRFWQE